MIFNDDMSVDNTPGDAQQYNYDVDDKMIIMFMILVFFSIKYPKFK